MTAIEISDLRAQDEGWYECSVVRLEGNDESTVNGSWIHLTINCTYLLCSINVADVFNRPQCVKCPSSVFVFATA